MIHHKKNTRLPGVRNDGIKLATGDYIVFVDGDDWLAKDYVSYFLKVITKKNSDFAINLVNYTTRDMTEVPEKETMYWSPEKATAELLWPKISIGAWNKIYKRDFIVKSNIKFKPLFTAEGFRFFTDISQRVSEVAVGCKKVYYYRKNNADSATTKYDIRQPLAAIDVAENIKKDLVIRTEPVINAIDHQIWVNHFWTIRQIIALKGRWKYREEYAKSRKYLHQNVLKIVRITDKFHSKFFALLCGILPNTTARIVNFHEKNELKRDIKSN